MAFQTVFKRYELKYMLTLEQKHKIQAFEGADYVITDATAGELAN